MLRCNRMIWWPFLESFYAQLSINGITFHHRSIHPSSHYDLLMQHFSDIDILHHFLNSINIRFSHRCVFVCLYYYYNVYQLHDLHFLHNPFLIYIYIVFFTSKIVFIWIFIMCVYACIRNRFKVKINPISMFTDLFRFFLSFPFCCISWKFETNIHSLADFITHLWQM